MNAEQVLGTDPAQLGLLAVAESGLVRAKDLHKLRPDARILHDLEMDGDNFYDLLVFLRDRFGVQSSGFEWTKFSPSEGDLLSLFNNRFFRLFGLGKDVSFERYPPITVTDVGAWIVNGVAAPPGPVESYRAE
jgi:hypothetical protein